MRSRGGRFGGVTAFVAIAALVLCAPPARAEVPVDAWDLMFAVGWYEPGPEVLDGDVSFSARIGKHWSRRSMLTGEVAFVRLDGDPAGGVSGDFDNKLTSIEFAYSHFFLPDKRTSFALAGGLGFASADLTGTLQVGEIQRELFGTGEDSFTASGSAAIRTNVNQNFYIRPAVRVKWFEQRDNDAIDAEFQIGFGLVLY